MLRCLNLLELDGGYVEVEGSDVRTDDNGNVIYAPEADLRRIRLRFGLVSRILIFPHLSNAEYY